MLLPVPVCLRADANVAHNSLYSRREPEPRRRSRWATCRFLSKRGRTTARRRAQAAADLGATTGGGYSGTSRASARIVAARTRQLFRYTVVWSFQWQSSACIAQATSSTSRGHEHGRAELERRSGSSTARACPAPQGSRIGVAVGPAPFTIVAHEALWPALQVRSALVLVRRDPVRQWRRATPGAARSAPRGAPPRLGPRRSGR